MLIQLRCNLLLKPFAYDVEVKGLLKNSLSELTGNLVAGTGKGFLWNREFSTLDTSITNPALCAAAVRREWWSC